MMNEKIINMKSEMQTLSRSNGHICSEIAEKIEDNVDVDYNYYDEDDVLSDVDYDSDSMEEKLSYKSRQNSHRFLDEEEEEEFSDDDDDDHEEEDKKIEHSIYIKLQNKKYTTALKGLTVLDGKLNWLEKTPLTDTLLSPSISLISNNEYPNIDIELPKAAKKLSSRIPSGEKIKFHPTKHIAVNIANTNFIGLKEVEQKFDQQIRKLCNAIREGKDCRFGDKCKFLHQIPDQKPNCKYGIKCGNRKCTFFHPDGKIKPKSPTPQQPTPPRKARSEDSNKPAKSVSPGNVEVTTSFDPSSYRKIWLCKNIFKISTTSGSLYDSIKIEENGHCRFGDNCVYAHSTEEIRQNLEHCKFKEECKSVKITQIKKDDKKVRRYENNSETRKCCRLHPKERVIDFIKRIQLQQ